MSSEDELEFPPTKRRRLDSDATTESDTPPPSTSSEAIEGEQTATSLQRPISPPALRRRRSRTPPPSTPRVAAAAHVTDQSPAPVPNGKEPIIAANPEEIDAKGTADDGKENKYLASPFQLTRIRDLAPCQNVDAVGLDDLLGDPMIKECWNFNFLFDLGFVMKHFDADVRATVKVKIVHGFWRRDDERGIAMLEMAERFPNIQLISAYMPDRFGTHHSKMLVLFRHDDSMQVVIHTANMIQRDWGNMTQAVWRSPILPLQSTTSSSPVEESASPIGSGERFKKDLTCYFRSYGHRLKHLTDQIDHYDFTSIRAAFLGSAPSRQKPTTTKSSLHTSFGWPGLQQILSTVPSRTPTPPTPPNIVIQVSSIATLGTDPKWLKNFHLILSHTKPASSSSPSASFFARPSKAAKLPDPTLNIIFPTASEIRTSLDGYDSGPSIHTKIQSPAQQQQLAYLHPLLCHWKHSDDGGAPPSSSSLQSARREAHRGPAAPHIKTYLRFSSRAHTSLDWALLTSANLSKQAWGELVNKNEEVWIQSYEAGVVVWPELFDDDAIMVPVFGRDGPREEDVDAYEGGGNRKGEGKGKTVVGLRMPYDLPLSSYKEGEGPWCATLPDGEEDWMGRVWRGY